MNPYKNEITTSTTTLETNLLNKLSLNFEIMVNMIIPLVKNNNSLNSLICFYNGPQGIGKSTFTQYILKHISDNNIDIDVLIVSADDEKDNDPDIKIQQAHKRCHTKAFKFLLESNNALVIVDNTFTKLWPDKGCWFNEIKKQQDINIHFVELKFLDETIVSSEKEKEELKHFLHNRTKERNRIIPIDIIEKYIDNCLNSKNYRYKDDIKKFQIEV